MTRPELCNNAGFTLNSTVREIGVNPALIFLSCFCEAASFARDSSGKANHSGKDRRHSHDAGHCSNPLCTALHLGGNMRLFSDKALHPPMSQFL